MPQDSFLNDNKKDEEELNGKDKRFRAKLSEKGFTIDYLRNDFEKSLPNLTKELNSITDSNAKFSLNKYAQDMIDFQTDEPELYQDEEIEDYFEEEGYNDDDNDFSKIEQTTIENDVNKLNDKNHDETLREFSQFNYEDIKKSIKSRVKSDYSENSELFLPKTEDFLRRCSNLKEAEEIIAFQLKQKYISEKQAEDLIKICREKGLTSFGPKKEWGYYERTYRNKSNSS